MSQAVICPVCKGSGKVGLDPPEGMETREKYKKPCHGCNGKGWVSVDSDPPAPTIVAYTGDYNEAK